MSTSQCSVGSWVKARHLTTQTNPTLLSLNSNDILQCLGGIQRCLSLLLKDRQLFTTLQINQLNNVITTINQNNKIKSNISNARLQISDIGSQCILYITSFLNISEIATSFSNVNSTFAIVGLEESKKLDCYYMNGNNLIDYNCNYKYINVIDIGFRSFLQQSRIYADITAEKMFSKWSEINNIPKQYLSIWYYGKRKNQTMRPNRELKLNWREPQTHMECEGITKEMVMTHTIPTEPNSKKIKSIYNRMGNIHMNKRQFMILDERKIVTIPYGNRHSKTDRFSRVASKWLILIKYFDIFSQKLRCVDWVYAVKDRTKIRDIAKYVENKILESDEFYFKECKKYLKEMIRYKLENKKVTNKQKHEHRFILYEELDSAGDIINALRYNTVIDDEFYSGDIFVFQLNPYNKYFRENNVLLKIETTFSQAYSGMHLKVGDFIEAMDK